MSTSLHAGKKRDITITASDASVIAPGTLTASSNNTAAVTVAVNPATNLVTVTGVAPGTATVTYAAPGFTALLEQFVVAPLPNLVAADGPEY